MSCASVKERCIDGTRQTHEEPHRGSEKRGRVSIQWSDLEDLISAGVGRMCVAFTNRVDVDWVFAGHDKLANETERPEAVSHKSQVEILRAASAKEDLGFQKWDDVRS